MKTVTKLWIGLGIFSILSPIGLILPEYFKAGDAWGEWGTDTIKSLVGYIPVGLEKISSLWTAPLPDYAFNGQETAGLAQLSFSYIFSAIAGIALCTSGIYLIGKLLTKKESEN